MHDSGAVFMRVISGRDADLFFTFKDILDATGTCHVQFASFLQGYLAHKKMRQPRTLQYAWGPMVVLGGGLFLMSEVPLHPFRLAPRYPRKVGYLLLEGSQW